MIMSINRMTQLIIAGTSVSTLTLGYYFLSRRNKNSASEMNESASKIVNWADKKGKGTIAKSMDQMQQLHYNVRQRVQRHLPDLYKATERIHLSAQID